jgi:low temperature requirement protein LtrA
VTEATTNTLEAEPERTDEFEEKVTPLELFFDLVFVFAFTQVTGLMAENPTWEGLGQGMLVLAAVWWAWGGYAWLTNSLHSDDGIARVGLLAAMAAMLVAALAVPEAFGDDSVVFGIAYFAVRAVHIAVYAYGAPDLNNQEAIRQLAPGLLAAPALIVVAGFLDGGAAAGLWVVALVIDYGTPYVRDVSGFTVSPSHFHERFGLIVIIALGESIVATGSGLDATGLTGGVVATAVAGLVIAGAQWWAYFDVVALVAGRRFAERDRVSQARMARDSYGVLHVLLIAGVVLVALGLKKALLEVEAPLETVPAFALCGGAALYLLGHVAFRLRNVGSLNRQRLFTGIVLVALIPFADAVDAVVAVAAVAIVHVVLIAYEAVHFREARERVRRQGAGTLSKPAGAG